MFLDKLLNLFPRIPEISQGIEEKTSLSSKLLAIAGNCLYKTSSLIPTSAIFYPLNKYYESSFKREPAESSYFPMICLTGALFSAYVLSLYKKNNTHGINHIIAQFNTLATLDHELTDDDRALYLNLIKATVDTKCGSLFNLYSLIDEDRKPFIVIDCLLRHDSSLEDLKQATEAVLSKLIELKTSRASITQESYVYPDPHPRVKDLTNALISLEKTLLLDDKDSLKKEIPTCLSLIATAKKHPIIFHQINPSTRSSENPFNETTLAALELDIQSLQTDIDNSSSYKIIKERLDTKSLKTVLLELKKYFFNPSSPLKCDIEALSSETTKALFVQSRPTQESEEDPLNELRELLTSPDVTPSQIKEKICTIDVIYDCNLKQYCNGDSAPTKEMHEEILKDLEQAIRIYNNA